MTKKLGLLTFHAAHNCGSMLQAFTLQSILKNLGHDIQIINFSNTNQKELYSIRYKNNSLKNILKNIITLPHTTKIKQTYQSYENFLKTNFILTPKSYHNITELDEQLLGFDEYICGSDQIWNITIADGDDAYFLPFVKNHKKIAYAPSFGAKNPAKYSSEPQRYANFLNAFDFLSIRENNGKKWVKDLTGKTVPVLLDPTLLANYNLYLETEQKIKTPKKFIFYYAPGYMKDLNKFVYQVSKRYHLPVIVFNAKQYYVKHLKKYGFILPEDENPSVYLYLMHHAELIFTTSFHGTIFSTIYHKKFWTLKNGGMFGDDDRVLTLMSQLGIEDRLILPKNTKTFDFFQSPDYTTYKKNLTNLQEISLNYLSDAINAKYPGESHV